MGTDGLHIRTQLEALYREIEQTRMEGVPILNPDLSVAAIGFEEYGTSYLGVLLTPWFMNLILVPVDQDEFAQGGLKVGDKTTVALPAGQVEFIVGHEDSLGFSMACSLFSPVFEFEDQDAMLETAKAVLAEVLDGSGEAEDDDADMHALWAGKLPEPEVEEEQISGTLSGDIDRRAFLRGGAPEQVAEEQP